ncbi:MAG TPA: hypothetical protein VK479_03195 [Micropepsaceae bacterium]|nr:hypothetical protein [Micropepsaceae bacterium]
MADVTNLPQLDPATTVVLLEDAPIMACSPRVAGKLFNVVQWHITQACNRGDIPKYAVGRKVVVFVSDIEAWIRTHQPAPAPKPKSKPETTP